ncbi:MAG: flagellar basal body P-ring formation chaperone FlgA [Gammaproteobacteria bacterium]|nr:flagellar basal body P-ring formation chaperone FlgA [Gammaproteobacteria bacterium]
MFSTTIVAKQVPGKVPAVQYQSIKSIKQAANDFLHNIHFAAADGSITAADGLINPADGSAKAKNSYSEEINIAVGKVDSRLKLAKCPVALNVFLPQGFKNFGKTTVAVKCEVSGNLSKTDKLKSHNWTVYVPANIEIYQMVWVTKRYVSKKESISRADIEQKRILKNRHRIAPVTKLEQLLNASPKSGLRAGQIIYPNNICLVCRGDQVNVSAGNQYFSVFVEGVALNNAIIGENVKIRNSQSNRIFTAIVTGKNELYVRLSGVN